MEQGFELVETPAAEIDPAAAQQPVQDLMGLLEGENEPQVAPAGEPPGAPSEPVVEPEQLAGEESAPTQEQPVVEDSEQDQPETYTLKVNGEERHVTLSDLKEGFQLKSDYTRKTQELAEREQQLGQQTQGVEQQQEQYSQLVNAVGQKLESMIPPEPNWAQLAQTDPIEHTRQRAAWDQLQSQMSAVNEEQQRLAGERQERFQQDYQGYLQQQQTKLYGVIPELKEPGKAQEFYSTLTQYAVNEYGYTPQEISTIGDHRLLLMADKARKYDLSQAGAKEKLVPQPHIPTLKPGARQGAEPVALKALRKATDRLERSGSTRDAASAIEALL